MFAPVQDGHRAGKNLGFLKRFLKGIFKVFTIFIYFCCTKTEHESTTQKHLKPRIFENRIRQPWTARLSVISVGVFVG